MEKVQKVRSRGFCITGWTDENLEKIKKEAEFAEYAIIGRELCPTTQKVHYQCYIRFDCQRFLNAVRKRLPGCHVDVQRGHDLQAGDYSFKDEDVVLEKGHRITQGKRSDLDEVRHLTTMQEIVTSAKSYQAIRMAEKALVYTEPKRDWRPQVIWFYGATGTGKSRGVHDSYPDVFIPQSFKWWEGYDGHENVLIDDFRADFCKFHDLLTLIDRYAYRVEFKGGSRQLRARRMFITSPYHPSSVYNGRTSEDVQQLLRRIDRVILVRLDECLNEIHEFM